MNINSNVVLIDSQEKVRKLIDSNLDILKIFVDTAVPEVYKEILQFFQFAKSAIVFKEMFQSDV